MMSELHLFDAFGIELEYMIVDEETLDIAPRADDVLLALNRLNDSSITVPPTDFEQGAITWSNELARHVLELKTTDPAKRLSRVASDFENALSAIKSTLSGDGLRLLPTAMHPWMNPATQTQLWPHEYHEIYETYDRIFDCRSHGWANVQSVHLNLPFHGEEEFAKLHAAVRLLLPILPALAASSPIVDGRATGRRDSRLQYYIDHCRVIPSLTGPIIPEAVYDESTYESTIFAPIRRDILPHDPNQVMNHEFLNARGAIARFDRGSIEVRVMDVQEYPGADLAICGLVVCVAKLLVAETWTSLDRQKEMPTSSLRTLLDQIIVDGERTVITDLEFLQHFAIDEPKITAKDLWTILIERARDGDSSLDAVAAPLEVIRKHGTLATRILKTLDVRPGDPISPEALHDVYQELADCLSRWEPFYPS
ncbi:carboxylate-amine ligase [Neorhodopirellula pilleata]|uniref:Carboxylate-amine ligase YbdK n=1 Tax=Neorhodopirellula pilleata TaxID=2714738 RepID=A0A5C5ZQH0_9BACT|nr:glutamate-cysteine ligase family protein [Neorhodopirellula pilleata]TWT89197.1 Carboxylate-amine ligase YbdK [Neorhodopirellula pilleata]